jgi:hypothetical protein
MSSNPNGKRWGRRWASLAVGLLVLYPMSMFPTSLMAEWAVEWKVVTAPRISAVILVVYAPVLWTAHHSTRLKDAAVSVADQLAPLSPASRRLPPANER